MKKEFTIITILITLIIIVTLSVIVAALPNTPRDVKQQAAQDACIKNGGVPILTGWNVMKDCKFKPKTIDETLPPCNASDINKSEVPPEIIRQIEDQRKGHCI